MRDSAAAAPVAVVGAGPCGLAAAVALKAARIPAVVFDKGCVAQSIANYPTRLTMFSTPEKLVIGDLPFASAGFRPTRAETLAYYRHVVAAHDLQVRQGAHVTDIRRTDDGYRVRVDQAAATPRSDATRGAGATHEAPEMAARAVVIATGYFDYPNMLGVPGEELPHVSHRFIDGQAASRRSVVVVGGGNSAVECAIELARCGARVTLVHYEPAFVSHVIKPWILPEFQAHMASGAIAVRWSTRVSRIEPGAVVLQGTSWAGAVDDATGAPGEPSVGEPVAAELVYLMTGYTPRPGLLGALGVRFDDETGVPAHDPATMETNVPGVFVAGVLTSGKKANGVFIENGRGHGALIAAALAAR